MAEQASVLMKEVLDVLTAQDISTISVVLYEILAMSRNPKADANDLANLCKRDIAGSARLLRASNSIYFGRRVDQPRVNTLKEAIVRLGFKKAQEILVSATLSPIMLAHGSVMDYTAGGLWKHSIAVGTCNRLLYNRKFGNSMSMDPYLAGLLHDIGIAIEYQALFDRGFSDAVQKRYVCESELFIEEHNSMGISHEDVGATVARAWNFPDYLLDVIGHHHSHDPAEHQSNRLLHINRVSEWICYFLNLGYSDFSKVYAEGLSTSQHVLELTQEDVQIVSSRLKTEMEGFINMSWFDPHLPQVA